MSKKFTKTLKKAKYLIPMLFLAPTLFLANCNKGHVEIIDILDSVENCSLPYVVYFYPKADVGNGDVSYYWDFGDGTSDNTRNPVHVYNKTGLFSVTLKIKNKETEDIKTKNLDLQSASLPIYPDFDLSFYGTGRFAPARFKFDNYSVHATSFRWLFDDGEETKLESPEHEFLFPGTYNVQLDAICNSDTVSKIETIVVEEAPNVIQIRDIRVWLPAQFLGANIFCDVRFNGRIIETSPLALGISGYPVVLPVSEIVPNFDYNNDYLSFEIWEEGNNISEIYKFEVFMSQIQTDYYPNFLVWDDGSDFAAEVDILYGMKK